MTCTRRSARGAVVRTAGASTSLVLLLAAAAAAACSGERRTESPGARALLRNAAGQEVGTATLVEEGDRVRVEVDVSGLPAGEHGIHVHQTGACEPPSFESAGEHVNPESRQHGLENPQGPHAGDLPNLEVGQDGRGRLDTATDRLSLSGGPANPLDADGSALVVHAGRDDQRTDPSGNSGDRIACGVIERG
ncbi:MAG TPA: superoxide dismutase family protein [Gemmatimonadota bacterium]|jgi:Cu-Zn family superoxide dismutase